jgi:hypothetical protein
MKIAEILKPKSEEDILEYLQNAEISITNETIELNYLGEITPRILNSYVIEVNGKPINYDKIEPYLKK